MSVKFQYCKINEFQRPLCNTMLIVNNAIVTVCTRKLVKLIELMLSAFAIIKKIFLKKVIQVTENVFYTNLGL